MGVGIKVRPLSKRESVSSSKCVLLRFITFDVLVVVLGTLIPSGGISLNVEASVLAWSLLF